LSRTRKKPRASHATPLCQRGGKWDALYIFTFPSQHALEVIKYTYIKDVPISTPSARIGSYPTSNLYEFQAQWLQVESGSVIQSICSEIVADFDGWHLEKRRDLYQQFKDLSKKKKN